MREHAPEPGTAMATTSSSWRVVEDVPNGGLTYTCEECCKSFNRLASYKAPVRTHAGNGQDGLDLVSKNICQETSSSVECRETLCKTRRSSGTSVAAGERARVVEEPHRVQSQVSAVADVRQAEQRCVFQWGRWFVSAVQWSRLVARTCEGTCFALSEHLFVQEREVLWSLGDC